MDLESAKVMDLGSSKAMGLEPDKAADLGSDKAMDLESDKRVFAERGFIGPHKLWEPEQMTAWWKEQRRALLDPKNNERAVFANPVNYDRHLDITALSKLVSEPAIVRRFQALIGADVLCWRTEFFPKNPGDPGTGWHQVETY